MLGQRRQHWVNNSCLLGSHVLPKQMLPATRKGTPGIKNLIKSKVGLIQIFLKLFQFIKQERHGYQINQKQNFVRLVWRFTNEIIRVILLAGIINDCS